MIEMQIAGQESSVQYKKYEIALINTRKELADLKGGTEEATGAIDEMIYSTNTARNALGMLDRSMQDFEVSTDESTDALINWSNIAESGMSSFTRGFEDVGKAIGEGADVWKAFQAAGMNAIAAVLEGLGHELSARAVVSLLALDFVGAGLATAGAAAAYTASGFMKTQIPSFDVGSIRIPETTTAVVHKDEMILTAPQAEQARREGISIGPSGGGGGEAVFMVDGVKVGKIIWNHGNAGRLGVIDKRVVK